MVGPIARPQELELVECQSASICLSNMLTTRTGIPAADPSGANKQEALHQPQYVNRFDSHFSSTLNNDIIHRTRD